METETEDRIQNRNDIIYLKRGMTELKRVIKGYNGTTGLVGRAEKTDLALGRLEKGMGEIKTLLTGDASDSEDVGLKGKQRDLRKMQKVVVRVAWLLVSVFITGSIGLIFYSIQLRIAAMAAALP